MKSVRWIVGRILLILNWVTFPSKGKRSEDELKKITDELSAYTLYEFKSCPFCIRVRRKLQKLNLSVNIKDAKVEGPDREDLLKGGGRVKVPCLRIKQGDTGLDQWMYESKTIMAFLEEKFPLPN